MKLAAGRLEAFLAAPDPAIGAALVFGPDEGLVRERVQRLIEAVAGAPADPFCYAEIAPAALRADPARLADEAAAPALTGARRLLRIRDAGDGVTEACANAVPAASGCALIVAEAGDLPKRSSLRRLFENAREAVAIACYGDEGASLTALIEATLAAEGMTATPEALAALAGLLGADRALSRSELAKLVLYRGAPGEIGVDDVLAVVGDASAVPLDAVTYAACGGDAPALDRALALAFAEGLQPVSILRAIAQHLIRLLRAGELIAAGRSSRDAIAALRPPVLFRRQAAFTRQLHIWSRPRLARALDLVTAAEFSCKTTGLPAPLICGRALLQIAAAARATDP
jgi:DNA polymerase-3 subunit delta